MNHDNRALGAGAQLGGVADGGARRARRRHRAGRHPPALRRIDRRVGVDGQRLRAQLRRPARPGRRARRPARPAAAVRRRSGSVRARLGRLRAGAQRRAADRGARRCRGRRRRWSRPLSLSLRQRGVHPRAAREGDGHLRRHHRPGRPQRPGRRWRRHPGPGLAVGVLDQRADRAGRHPAGADADPGELRPPGAAGRARTGAGDGGRLRHRVGTDAGQRRRVGQRRGDRDPDGRSRRPGGVRVRRAPGAGADAAAADVPPARVLGRHRRQLPVLVLAVLGRVLHGPVPADLTRPGPPGLGAAATAVDRNAVPGGTGRRGAHQPDRRAPAGDAGAGDAGRRHGLGRADRDAGDDLLAHDRAAGDRRGGDLDGDPELPRTR